MNPLEERDQRWIAYHLGDLSEDEKAKVEAELREDPEKAIQFKELIEGIERWAAEPVPYTPLEISDLRLDRTQPFGSGEAESWSGASRRGPAMAWTWTLAAAALLVFALSMTEFTISFGQTELTWGRPAADPAVGEVSAQLAGIASELGELAQETLVSRDQIRQLAEWNAEIEHDFLLTTTELMRIQADESQMRYQDDQNLLTLAGFSPATQSGRDGVMPRSSP